ncbi:ABC transporter ATP-binding protein, partial [Mesorhizobium sp. M2C.T.Ca.TU.009.01.2.1]
MPTSKRASESVLMSDPDIILSLAGIAKSFGEKAALSHVDLDVRR